MNLNLQKPTQNQRAKRKRGHAVINRDGRSNLEKGDDVQPEGICSVQFKISKETHNLLIWGSEEEK
jgi:hypothetical protein